MNTPTADSHIQDPVFIIQPTRGWGRLGLHEIWDYRDLLYFLLWREIKGRYKQMALGPLWIVLRPLFNMLLFTLIFSMVAKLPSDGLPYPIFTYTALLPWTFFAGAVMGASNSLLANRHLITKVYFPRLIVPIVSVLSGLIDFSISFVILLGMMAFYGYAPSWGILWLPVYLLLAAVTALTVGLWAATWIVHYHDVGEILSYLIRGWMYATPVVYAVSIIPEGWQSLYRFNPMTNVIEGFRWALLGSGQTPDKFLALSALLVLPCFIAGAFYFRRTERTIVDIA
ncbi:phosphate ABC transporter permease [candidate division KSB3 bacterium]|uniref:Transport permease protein n=1 Tax=candidate division KSB3 bacterium TaxID=2044937 RepID=A0A2G6E1U1_9BACT|nr:MAG: phosphate ABC transporter permease [candidate division KSB3 bacterium]PIE28540.1 MAG: phosphate ABC transporter permease [candidate division KSB3 bacterium]